MVKTYKTSEVLPYSWTHIALTFFHRYPNPFSRHVLTVDTISRSITPDGHLYTKRLLTKTNNVPKFGAFIFKSSKSKAQATIIEESLIDAKNRTIYTLTRNIGFTTKFMSVTEVNIFEAELDDPERATLLRKEATIVSRFFGLRRPLESFGLDRFKKNSARATRGFLYVLEKRYGVLDMRSQKMSGTGAAAKNVNRGRRYFNVAYWTDRFLSKST